MADVLVMTDTVACIPAELAKEHGIRIVPAANITVGDKDYIEGVTLSAAEAYAIIKRDPDHFMTSAVTPGLLLDEFRKLSKEHQDILFVTISSKLSAVAQSANLAAESLKEESPQTRIRVVIPGPVPGERDLSPWQWPGRRRWVWTSTVWPVSLRRCGRRRVVY